MKVAILAGGLGTRIGEETTSRPKPMIEIGGRPILWHIMKHYSSYGFTDFVILAGYKSYIIKEYFANYFLHHSDVTFDTKQGTMEVHSNASETWKVTVVDTGAETQTGGRVLRAKKHLDGGTFMLTYGDGVTDLNIEKLVEFHRERGQVLTMTAVQPEGRFGAIQMDEKGKVEKFLEKPKGDGAWINGGFFVCEPKLFDYITEGDRTIFERTPMESLARDGQLGAYRYDGFWKCMDTLRDKNELESLWASGKAKWRANV